MMMVAWLVWLAAVWGIPLAGCANVVYYQRMDGAGPTDVMARFTDSQATIVAGSSAWNKILGMAVHDENAKLYWSDGHVIWRSNVDGTSREVFLGAVARVTWKGYNFGAVGTPVALTVLTQRCLSIVSRTPTEVTCEMRVNSALAAAATPIKAASVSIETEFGHARGTTDGADDLFASKAFTKPLVQSVSIQVTYPSPHELAIDNVDANAAWLYFADPDHGTIYQTHVHDSRVRVVAAREWSVRGLSIFGSILRYSVESKGTVFALDMANATAAPIPIVVKLTSPRGIALDHIHAMLYVVERGGKIYRAQADGMRFPNRQRDMVQVERVLGLSTFTRLHGVAVDVANGVLYWTECGTNVVGRTLLSSMERQVVAGRPNSVVNWPRHVHVSRQSGNVFFSEYGGRIWTGDATAPFTAVVNDASASMVETNAMDHRPVHFFALD
ncbi:hypothetical protein H310_12061 [Aphanomyces invadans]|uniref:Uncharacterized protein n=1 Tax=Aphanomyces invadans TaxID=157072 RepID=A0A024TK67_9STRA|nr:hypothetical protein H310_12061 [Aphanomyces invadans]ETV94006.1 hypothetical protein H310_12061 [Aphanomyces invadans]|eukprot:XP_008877209.1 hypothetical protein H310_12061 [Aphanomyces invadans]